MTNKANDKKTLNLIDLESAINGMKDVDIMLKSVGANISTFHPEYVDRAMTLINEIFDKRYNALLLEFYRN